MQISFTEKDLFKELENPLKRNIRLKYFDGEMIHAFLAAMPLISKGKRVKTNRKVKIKCSACLNANHLWQYCSHF
jgi:hypothetical protein